jgi:uncharacterized protein YndB with AHSA1/START domain
MQWSEEMLVERPVPIVHRAIADEHQLMQWSAWPAATGFTCAVDGDGTSLGSAIVFQNRDGVVQGRQTLTSVEPDRVEYRLRNRGPGGRDIVAEVDFVLAEHEEGTLVRLDFRAEVPLPPGPRQIVEAVMRRRIRALHVQDLEQLRTHVEARSSHP